MTQEKPGIKQAIEQILDERRKAGSEALAPEELLAYRDGTYSTQEEAALLERLSLDKDGINCLIDLEALSRGERIDDPALSQASQEAAWQEMQARIQCEEGQLISMDEASHKPTGNGPGWVIHGLWLAACFALGFLSYSLYQSNRRLLAPSLDGQVLVIALGNNIQRGDEKRLDSASRRSYRFDLPNLHRDYPYFGLDIIALDRSEVIFSRRETGPRKALSLSLNRQWFKRPGNYRIVVYGERNGQRHKIGDMDLSIAF